MIKSILLVAIVVVAGFLQNTAFLDIAGITPNLSLVILIVLAPLVDDFLLYLIMVLASGSMLRFDAGIGGPVLIFMLVAVAAYMVNKHFLWARSFGNLLLIALATVLFYALAAPSFLVNFWPLVLWEAVYNLVLGFIFYLILGHEEKTRSQF